MTCPLRPVHLLVAGLLAATAAAGPLAQIAEAKSTRPAVPNAIRVPAGNLAFLVGHAVGVQIYACNATPTVPAWGLVAPRAELRNDRGKLIATHFAGPTWQAKDGSTVVARRVGDGVTVDRTAIPWLLLEAASTTAGAEGDRLTATTYIQRTATTAGLAPATSQCNGATVGTTAEVPYTADYTFWRKAGC